MKREWPALPPGYVWDHSTSPSTCRGPDGWAKMAGGGPNQVARIAWARHREQTSGEPAT